MIEVNNLISLIEKKGTDFYAGVPDSLLKEFCIYLSTNKDSQHHIVTANEGNAIGLAIGYYLSTGKIPLVYMQNSGLGNVVNPLVSLADSQIYSIPILLFIGFRGEPGLKDEPQHIKQGQITEELLDVLGIHYEIMSDNPEDYGKQISDAYSYMNKTKRSFAFIIRKNTFAKAHEQLKENWCSNITREEAIDSVITSLDKDSFIVSTTGMASRELYELRNKYKQEHSHDFLTVGGMGHANQIALGIALNKPEKSIICIDGDGAFLMHMGSGGIIGSQKPQNLLHILINNSAHDSVGGIPTISSEIDLCKIAKSFGYKKIFKIHDKKKIRKAINSFYKNHELTFIEIDVRCGHRKDLGRPIEKPIDNKQEFMKALMN